MKGCIGILSPLLMVNGFVWPWPHLNHLIKFMYPRNHILDGGPDPPQEGALLRGTAMRLFVKLLWTLVILLLLSCIPCMQCIRCSLFLQMLHVAWSVCLFVSKRTVKMAAIHRPASNGIAKMAIDSILQSRLQWFMILHMTLLVRAFSKFKAESYQSDTFAILQLWPCCSYNWL